MAVKDKIQEGPLPSTSTSMLSKNHGLIHKSLRISLLRHCFIISEDYFRILKLTYASLTSISWGSAKVYFLGLSQGQKDLKETEYWVLFYNSSDCGQIAFFINE